MGVDCPRLWEDFLLLGLGPVNGNADDTGPSPETEVEVVEPDESD